ncbi:MAG TPA: hypothetical protein VFL66_00945 [Gaiellaceae bacterium]|nr:hypothetical protein [Gaiellaceae bacterium]
MSIVSRIARIAGSGISSALAVGLAIFAVASFGAAATGESGDMWVGAVVGLGLLYALLAAGAATLAWKLWPRGPAGRSRV